MRKFAAKIREIMKEYKAEKVTGMSTDTKATEIMNRYAVQGFRVLRTEVLSSHLLIIFECDR